MTIETQGASEATIEQTLERLGATGNPWLRDAWRRNDGCLLGDMLMLYATADIEERNSTYEVAQYFPGMLAVGDDSGGRLVLLAKEGSSGLYLIDAGDPFLDDAERFESLDELLEMLRNE